MCGDLVDGALGEGRVGVRLEVVGALAPDALVDLTAAAVGELRLAPRQPVWLSAKATELTAYPERPVS